ncbi:MAG: ATP-grasp domain-containing protein [Myxococcales bacterium]|nr:ATP-grasp domain-containing protein [Myxococcales bacterium]
MRPVVLVLQPGFPAEVPYYVRGLARRGALVLGVGDMPEGALSPVTREALSAYLRVDRLFDAPSLIDAIRRWDLPLKLDRVEALWEMTVDLSAEVREAFRLPGLHPTQAGWFRDKDAMRQVLERAGIRNPRFARARGIEELRAAARHVRFPLIVKPLAGAGSANTHRVDSAAALEALIPALGRHTTFIVEEFVRGDEYTFDALSHQGEILFHSILRYRPTMLESRSQEWISPQNMVLRDLDTPLFRRAHALGRDVLRALRYPGGITHMEWFHTPEDELVFGEIAARPPGGMTGELMNYACDFDVYEAWADSVLRGRIEQRIERRYNVGMVFKRAMGQGRIAHVEGYETMRRMLGGALVRTDLLPIGAHRRDWKNTLLSDGFVILRHPDLRVATEMSSWIAENLRLYAR